MVKQRYLGLGRSHGGGGFENCWGALEPGTKPSCSATGGQLTHSKPLPLQPCADCVVTYVTCVYFVNIFPPWLTCSSNSMFLSVLWRNNYFLCQHTIRTFFTCPLSLLYPVNRAGSFCSAVLTQKKGSLTNEQTGQTSVTCGGADSNNLLKGPEMFGSHSTTRLILVFPFVASSFFP